MTQSNELPETPSFRLDGRRALVTGAGRGLGMAMSAALAQAGAEVFVTARSLNEIEAVAAAIQDRGGKAQAIELDVTETAKVEKIVGDNGPFDILINNAGTNRPAALVDISEQDYDTVSDINVRAVTFVSKAVVKGLIDAGKPGSIINISSQMGHIGGPKRTVYCATKFAVEGITKALALELGEHGIRVNTICPTFFETELTTKVLSDPEFRQMVLSKIALGRLGELSDIMGAAVFLASDASSLITGSSLMIDGGWTAA